MKTQKETIRKMVGHLNNEESNGGFWLPNIQRPFVWREDQIARLFDSIMRDYPISTLLIWRTKSEIRRRKFIDNYKAGLKLTDYYVPEDSSAKMLVLDGQQRLQSLFIGLKGSYEKKQLYFNVLSGDLAAPEDIRYQFKFLAKDRAAFPWVLFRSIVEFNDLPNKLADRIARDAGRDLTDAESRRVIENVWKAIQNFKTNEAIAYQELDSIDNPDAYREDDVVEIFIRANSGGTKLGKSDLLFSLLTSSWEDADERMEELLDELNRSGYEFTRDFILKTCLTLLGKGARYDVSKFRDGATKEAIISRWDELSAAIKDVRDFLYGRTFIRTDRAMPSYLGLIPLIYMRFHYPNEWKAAEGIREYLLRTLATGAFSGTPDNLIDRCVRQIDQDGGFDLREIFGVIRSDGRSLELTKDVLFDIHYGSKEIHLLFSIWYPAMNYQPAYENSLPQVDHIFPQSLLRKVKVANPETGVKNLLKYYAPDRDQLANCMLLTAEENGFAGKCATPPEEWFAGKSDDYLELHLIPKDPDLWKLENYEKFVDARKALIKEKFSYLLQAEQTGGSGTEIN